MMIVNFICTSRTGDDRTASADLGKFVPVNVTVRGDVAATRFAIRTRSIAIRHGFVRSSDERDFRSDEETAPQLPTHSCGHRAGDRTADTFYCARLSGGVASEKADRAAFAGGPSLGKHPGRAATLGGVAHLVSQIAKRTTLMA
jgi:hypothetical protein